VAVLALAAAAHSAPFAGSQPAPALPAPAPLPAWTPGTLDIHHIVTGRGNSTFAQLPDGTTLLVDAGAVPASIPYADPLPDGSRSPGAWIVDYVRQMHAAGAKARLDYALVTHFHNDQSSQTWRRPP